jgi:TonB-dependent starch-binding outer membrane protein SusC
MKNLFVKLLVITVFVIGITPSYAQNFVSGIVTDSVSGEVVIGAKVKIKGTNTTTETDIDGAFAIKASIGSTLIVSCLGLDKEVEVVVDRAQALRVMLSIPINVDFDCIFLPSIPIHSIPKTNINEKDFNKGVISDPAIPLQGKVAGLSIYNRGGNPNTLAIMRLRGISTMGNHLQPLIVIDGIVGASISNVDPHDIESFEVLKDGSACAAYGIRGSAGVIEIRTKKAARRLPALSYLGQIGSSISNPGIQVMTADEFIATGGINLGSKTDWVKEITRTGFANNHHLVAQIDKKIGGRISANLRSVDGVLNSSGFDQINLRGNVNSYLLKNKLKINLNGSWTKRISDFGFEDAFQYALTQNPTAPVYGKDADPDFNAEQYGGYFENIGLVDSYNPVSILAQNKFSGKLATLNYNGGIEYTNLKNLSLQVNYGRQKIANDRRAIFLPTSHYRGEASNPTGKGLAELAAEESTFDLLEASAEYTRYFNDNKLVMKAGYAYQQSKTYDASLGFSDFSADLITFFEEMDLINVNNRKSLVISAPNEVIQSAYAKTHFSMAKQSLFIDASLRRDESNRLGENSKWGIFPAISAGINLRNYLNLYKLHSLVLRVGYGVTGALPQIYGLSQELKKIVVNPDGGLSTVIERQGNANLKWEEKGEINVGLDLNTKRLSASLDLYDRNIKDFVTLSDQGNVFQYLNSGRIKAKGVELTINYKMIDRKSMNYITGLVFSSNKSVLKDVIKDGFIGDFGGIEGVGSTPTMLKKGEEIGNFYGPVFEKSGADGRPVFKDINGDGTINTIKDYNKDSDLAILGNGNPDLELGWTNQLEIGNWEFVGFFRGAFGHSLINGFRLFHENESPLQSGYNYVNTSKKVDGLTQPVFSSLYVERADFFKLDYLTIARKINVKRLRNLKVSVTGQNLFVLTRYTGGDPEPMLVDYGSKGNKSFLGSSTNSVLSPGLDQQSNYFTSRTLVLSIGLGF